MSACTFFGHKECSSLNRKVLRVTIEALIEEGVDTFYVGNQGRFDSEVYHCLKQLQQTHPHISVSIVLAYLPVKKKEAVPDSIYPEIEGHPRFAIERRNRWMIEASDYCICYVNQYWGGAHTFAQFAKRYGLTVINLGSALLTK